MSDLVQTPLATEPNLPFEANPSGDTQGQQTLYSLETESPELIQVVRVLVTYSEDVNDWLIVRLVDLSGQIVFTQATPFFSGD